VRLPSQSPEKWLKLILKILEWLEWIHDLVDYFLHLT